jgi:hypothetical protein
MAALLDSLHATAQGKILVALGAHQAEHILGMAESIVDSARYLAPHYAEIAAWRGGTPIGFAAMGVADTGTFTLRLDRESIPPMQTLATLVQPAIAYLRLPGLTPEMITSPKLLADWTSIAAAAGPAPTSASLASLHEFLVVTMGPIDLPSCRTAVASLDTETNHAASDLFTIRRRQFRAAMVGRCGATSARAAADYDRLRDLFTSSLAGRFPFVDSARADKAPDADPADIRRFYQLYDAFATSSEPELRSDARTSPRARSAFTFLDQVAGARRFLSPFLDSAVVRSEPEYAFVVAGSDSAAATSAEGEWHFGEPISSELEEAAPSRAATGILGRWRLVKLAMLRRDIGLRLYHPDTMVELPLPVFPTAAPAISRPRAP